MKFETLRPMLWTDNIKESIAFYTGILGFTVKGKNDDWGWASLCKDNVWLMLAKPNAHAGFEKPEFTGSLYITTDNADDAWEMLKDKAKICYEIETFEWDMREFAIYDNNGYIIQIGQDISNTGKK